MKTWIWLLTLCAVGALAQQAPVYESKGSILPRALAPQPVAFSHKTHAAQDLQCANCHSGGKTKARAGLPQAELCLVCHATIATENPEVAKLADFAAKQEPIRWIRAYQVPEFVFFSHAEHASVATCQQCHGPVAQREVLAQEVSVLMTACMNCHAEHAAPRDCHICHELGQ